jgi:lysophospholipase L1-like esterase
MGGKLMIRQALLIGAVVALLAGCSSAATPSGSEPLTSVSVTSPAHSPDSSSSPATPSPAPSLADRWQFVAIGDSIQYNSPADCPLCTGLVDRYAKAIEDQTGHAVNVSNQSEHNGLQVDNLLAELASASDQNTLAHADIIVVGIAHNDVPMNRDDDPCDGAGGDNPDWSKYTAACVKADVAIFQPKYVSVFKQIAALRAGKPTILRALNRYNDWNDGHSLSPAGIAATKLVIDAWSKMICGAAVANGFLCADIYSAFNGRDGLKPSGDLLAADYTHPSDKGNEVIAKTLFDLGLAPLVRP